MIQTYENAKIQDQFNDLRERAEKQDIWPKEEFVYCCLAVQKSEDYGFKGGDPMGSATTENGLLFLMNDRVLWLFPQKDKTFWTGGTTRHFSIQFMWRTVDHVGETPSGKTSFLQGALKESVTFVTKAGDRQFLLSSIPDISEFVNRANDILTAALGSGSQTVVQAQPSDDIPTQIKKLADLRDAGILTDDEFEAKKGDLLSKM